MIKFKKIKYKELNAKQKENHNFHVVSALLSQYGYAALRLTDDWQGADFIAVHINGKSFLRVQLKGRICFLKNYVGKKLYIAAPCEGAWFLYPHDQLLKIIKPGIGNSKSWRRQGAYSFPHPSKELLQKVNKYCIGKVSFKTK